MSYANETRQWTNSSDAGSLVALPPAALITFAAVELLISLWAVSCNLVVMIAFVKSSAAKVANTDYLIFSLALTDFLCGLIAIPYGTVQSHLTRLVPSMRTLVFSKHACLAQVCIMVFLLGLSLLHLPVIAVERCITVCCSRQISTKLTRAHTKGLIVGCWAYAATLAVLPVFWVGRWVPGNRCRVDDVYHDFMTYVLLPHFPISFISSCIFYIIIITKVNLQRRRVDAWSVHMVHANPLPSTTHPMVAAIGSLGGSSKASDTSVARKNGFKKTRWDSQVRLAKTTGIILCVFILLWLPYTVVYVTSKRIGDTDTSVAWRVMRIVAVELTELNSAINPLVYGVMSRKLRIMIKRVLLGRN